MLYLTCTMISSVDLAHYGVSRAKDWVSVDCGTMYIVKLDRSFWCLHRLSRALTFRQNVIAGPHVVENV